MSLVSERSLKKMALPDGYSITRGSEVDRDGMFLELSKSGSVVAEAFYSDQTKRISISCFQPSLPIETVEFLTSEAWRCLPPGVSVDESLEPEHLLDIQTDSGGSQVFIHADAEGLATLERSIESLRSTVGKGDCDHGHLFAQDWGGNDLSRSHLSDGMRHVSHVKIYGWSKDWLDKNPRDHEGTESND